MSGLPVWAVPAQASRAGRDEPIVTVDAGSHVRPVGSECGRVPPSSASLQCLPPSTRPTSGSTSVDGMPSPGSTLGRADGLRTRALLLSFSCLVGVGGGGGGPCADPSKASQAYRISTLPAATLLTLCFGLIYSPLRTSYFLPSLRPTRFHVLEARNSTPDTGPALS